ncbi:hypothetical protein [Oceanospirillum beijerinckii]|uniref:hypothetical protein n=1 Tax=Oceanospirillum beijerinckii TaxID=64976 RepID=UPI0004251281|nr:hypothetical protein [Oceanospirillum beijerinckii]
MGLWSSFKKGVKSVCGTITGKKKAEQAKEKFAELEREFKKRNKAYSEFVEFKTSEIAKQVQVINELKMQTFSGAFPEFLNVANRLHNVSIRGKPILDAVAIPEKMIHTPEAVRSKQDILTIDFDDLSTKQKVVGVLTFGISTRKAAKESLKRAEDEEQRLKEEYAKMDATQVKLKHTLTALKEIAHYYRSIIELYGKTVKRLSHGIAAQQVSHIAFSGQFVGKVDFRTLPTRQLEDFMALYNMTILLKEMASRQYLSMPTESRPELELDKKDMDLTELAKANPQQFGMAA